MSRSVPADQARGYHESTGKHTGERERDIALQQVMTAGRELGLAFLSLNAATARALKMHPTDAWILSYLQGVGPDEPLTPGDLARITDLTTGSITGVIDRLEANGYVRRERDTQDRRKVIIRPTDKSASIAHVFKPLIEDSMELGLEFTTEELQLVTRYLTAGKQVTERTIERLRKV
ncbi:MarR family winged helix-turn-helix transcriptional regulator [Streptomyces sp. NPDC058576]|uniref:MarR family winged helix-turn-helix transcriptional regulator n=1 Tax=Streptomyces sp. NPDC058576 TaxID=3346547 RepID=UPI0036582ABD